MTQQSLVVFAKEKQRVSAFYQHTLGLAVVESDTSYDLLSGHGCEVLIHAIPPGLADDITLTQPPSPREESAFKPCFVVASLSATRNAAASTGGGLKPDSAAWQYCGHVVLDGWDPEGNIIQFRQPAGAAAGAGTP